MAKPVIPNKRTAFESVRTLIGNENQVIRELGLPYTVKPNTTLNQLLGINQSMHPPHTTIPTIGYFCIGYGGISLQNCTNDSDAFPMPKSSNILLKILAYLNPFLLSCVSLIMT